MSQVNSLISNLNTAAVSESSKRPIGSFSSPATQADNRLLFSRHLSERLHRRQIEFTPDRINRLQSAIDRAAEKGSRDSVVFLDELALLVNVSSRTVVTAIQTERMKEGVFTNIDSVVVG